jgi:hypothetical protein
MGMAILQAILGLITRSLGRVVSAMFGWAVVALFGPTTSREKIVLSGLVGAAAIWPVLLLGIVIPKIAVFALSFVPVPAWVPQWTVRVVWIVLAAAVPFAVGLTMAARRVSADVSVRTGIVPGSAAKPQLSAESPRKEARLKRLLRGFPITIGIAASFVIMFVTVPVLRVTSMIRRRIDVQVPVVTDAKSYETVADTVARTLNDYGFTVRRAEPGWWVTMPSRILLRLGGPTFRPYIPERLAYFRGPKLEAVLYPNGLLLRGAEQDTAWAQGVVVEALTAAPAYQTFDPGAQDIERQIRRIWSVYRENPVAHREASALRARLAEIGLDIRNLPVPYDEWQIVYRQALQLDRALRGEKQLLAATSSSSSNDHSRASEEVKMPTPMVNDRSARDLSLRELISEITGKASVLVKKEVDLAKAEIRADVKSELGMVKGLAAALVAALSGVNLLLVALVLGLSAWLPGWLAAVIVAATVFIIGGVVGYVSWTRRVKTPLASTRKTLKEDVQWAKERLA